MIPPRVRISIKRRGRKKERERATISQAVRDLTVARPITIPITDPVTMQAVDTNPGDVAISLPPTPPEGKQMVVKNVGPGNVMIEVPGDALGDELNKYQSARYVSHNGEWVRTA